MIERLRGLIKNNHKGKSIQFMLSLSFTSIAVLGMVFVGFMLYARFVASSSEVIIEDNQRLIEQVSLNLDAYIRSMMRTSDAMYYTVIKNIDISTEKMDKEMNLLYEVNKGSLIGVACFSEQGELLGAAPVSDLKPGVDVTKQEWFINANEKIENLHFSTPHVRNLFDESNYRYYWVISLSRVVELTKAGYTSRGTLVVDMSFSGIEQLFSKVNTGDGTYVYLMDGEGEIIYHPRQKLIYSNLFQENNQGAVVYEDGNHIEKFEGVERSVVVHTVGYTGWKIVSVTPVSQFSMSLGQMRFFMVAILAFSLILITFLNLILSAQIANPIKKLENSVKDLEKGNLGSDLDIYIGGSHEVQHLGRTVRSMVEQMRRLMDGIVQEQEEKRKSELDALQSQINPHFLYNTLDSIVWMIECERYDEAISMVTELASLFRISLSKGQNVISIDKELQHARNYINIQKVRYRNKFQVIYDINPDILTFGTMKLILQPILENAIYYGMEAMGDEGLIYIRGYQIDEEIYLEVGDNGLGMPESMSEKLLDEHNQLPKRGSGIGLLNVHQRIQICFGTDYGLQIKSEPDVGTKVIIHLPAILYSEYVVKEEETDEKA